MPNLFAGMFSRSASNTEAEPDYSAQLEAAAAIGGQIATLEAEKTALSLQVSGLTASLDKVNLSLTSAVETLQAEAKSAVVIAYGVQTPATEAECALIAAETDPAKLSALITRYRAATPASLGAGAAGKRETIPVEQSQPVATADRKAKLDAARADEEAKQAKAKARGVK